MDLLRNLKRTCPPGDKFRELNSAVSNLSDDRLEEIFADLCGDRTGENLLVTLANKYKRPDLLIRLLENCSTEAVRKNAAKSPLLYTERSSLMKISYFKSLLSKLSYATREAIVYSAGFHVEKESVADQIFLFIADKYGIFRAASVLPACSDGIISDIVGSSNVVLKDRQLLQLIKRKLQLGIQLIEKLCVKRIFSAERYKSTLNYLADEHPGKLADVLHNYRKQVIFPLNYKLGSCRTKKFLRANAALNIDEVLFKYHEYLRMDQVRAYLGWNDYKTRCASLLKKEMSCKEYVEITDLLESKFLRHLPVEKQRELIETCCKQVYNVDVGHGGQFLSPNLIHLLSPENRIQIANWKLKNEDDNCALTTADIRIFVYNKEAFWTAMKPLDQSIPQLMKLLLKEQTPDGRGDVAECLIISCALNRDSHELLKVLQTLTQRCRNDQSNVRSRIVSALASAIHFVHFEQGHWDCLLEILRIQKLYKEFNFPDEKLFHTALASNFQNNRSRADFIKFFVTAGRHTDSFPYSYTCKPALTCKPLNPKQQKTLFREFIDALGLNSDQSDSNTNRRFLGQVVEQMIIEIRTWNHTHGKKHGKISLQDFPRLADLSLEILTWYTDDDDFTWGQGVPTYVRSLKYLLAPEQLYNCLGSYNLGEEFLLWTVKRNPSIIVEHSDKIISEILESTGQLRSKKHKYHQFLLKLRDDVQFVPLAEKLLDECRRASTSCGYSEEQLIEVCKVFLVLSQPWESVKYATRFIPAEPKLNTEDDIDEVDYSLKAAVAFYLKYISDVHVGVPLILKFCVGDFLKLSIGSLFSITLNTPASAVMPILKNELTDRPVSFLKHMIRLYFTISSLEDYLELLPQLWSTQRNPSIRIEIFRRVTYVFFSSGSTEAWLLYKSVLESLMPDDQVCLPFALGKIGSACPTKHLNSVLQAYVETLDRLEAEQKYHIMFLELVTEVLDQVDDTFVVRLLDEKLSQLKHDEVLPLVSLTERFLLTTDKEKLQKRLELLTRILKNLVDHQWDDNETQYTGTRGRQLVLYPAREFMASLVRSFKGRNNDEFTMSQKDSLKKIFQELEQVLRNTPNIFKTFWDLLYVQLVLTLFDVDEDELLQKARRFGEHVAPVLASCTSRFGGEVVTVVSAVLKEFVSSNLKESNSAEEVAFEVISGILSCGRTRHNFIYSLALLPPESCDSALDAENIRKTVVEWIQTCEDPTVKIFFALGQRMGH